MREWIQAAVTIPTNASHTLAADCAPELPDDPDPRDMKVMYTGRLNYTAIARLLKPMLPDLRVSGVGLGGSEGSVRRQILCKLYVLVRSVSL